MKKPAIILGLFASLAGAGLAEGGHSHSGHSGRLRRSLLSPQQDDWDSLPATRGADCRDGAPCATRRALREVVAQADPEELYVQGTPVEAAQPGWAPWPYHSWGPWPTVRGACVSDCRMMLTARENKSSARRDGADATGGNLHGRLNPFCDSCAV